MTQKTLFLTHVGEMGGAEAKMLTLAKATLHSEICIFQKGRLESAIKKQNIPYSTLLIHKKVSTFKRDQTLLDAVGKLPYILRFIKDLARKQREYDIIICMSQKSFLLSSFANIFARKPLIWFMNDHLTTAHFSKSVMRLLTFTARFCASHIIVNSQSSKEAWLHSGGQSRDLSVLYSGIDIKNVVERIENKTEIQNIRNQYALPDTPLIGIFGRICDWKGQDIFIEALSNLDNVHGIIVGGAQFGEQDDLNSLKKRVKDLGLEKRITFTGHIEAIPEHMAACDIIVHCSTAPEPFGRVIAEAMLTKTLVIASNAGGAREIVIDGKTGFMHPMGDVQALYKTLNKVLNELNDQEKETIIDNAYAHAASLFSSEVMVTGFHKILQKYTRKESGK